MYFIARLIAAGGGEVVESLPTTLQDVTHILAESKQLTQIQVPTVLLPGGGNSGYFSFKAAIPLSLTTDKIDWLP